MNFPMQTFMSGGHRIANKLKEIGSRRSAAAPGSTSGRQYNQIVCKYKIKRYVNIKSTTCFYILTFITATSNSYARMELIVPNFISVL